MSVFTLKVNGQSHTVDVDPTTPLLYVLSDDLALKGPKFGCGLGQCGSCTAIVNGRAIRSCRTPVSTVNGAVMLAVPDTAKADLSATCVNGGIIVTGLNLETAEQSRRRVTGKINGGGTPIELRTTNGGIRLRARSEGAGSE